MYYGGSCTAPTPVTCCYSNDSADKVDAIACTKDGSQPQFGQCTAQPKDCADAKQHAATGCAAACDDAFKQSLMDAVCATTTSASNTTVPAATTTAVRTTTVPAATTTAASTTTVPAATTKTPTNIPTPPLLPPVPLPVCRNGMCLDSAACPTNQPGSCGDIDLTGDGSTLDWLHWVGKNAATKSGGGLIQCACQTNACPCTTTGALSYNTSPTSFSWSDGSGTLTTGSKDLHGISYSRLSNYVTIPPSSGDIVVTVYAGISDNTPAEFSAVLKDHTEKKKKTNHTEIKLRSRYTPQTSSYVDVVWTVTVPPPSRQNDTSALPLGTRCKCNGRTSDDNNGGGAACTSIFNQKKYCYTDIGACEDGMASGKLKHTAEYSFNACAQHRTLELVWTAISAMSPWRGAKLQAVAVSHAATAATTEAPSSSSSSSNSSNTAAPTAVVPVGRQIEIKQSGDGFDWKISSTTAGVVAGADNFPAISLQVGDVVTFSGTTGLAHRFNLVTKAGSTPESGFPTGKGQVFSVIWTADKEGTYEYQCLPHRSAMKGVLKVKAATTTACNAGYYLNGDTCHKCSNNMCSDGQYREGYCGGGRDDDFRCTTYAGNCPNGKLVTITSRRQDNHCGSCMAGFVLVGRNCSQRTTTATTTTTKTTIITTTTRTTMTQITDCAYTLSTCTAACEVGASRTITVTREPSSVQAKKCPSKTDLPDCLPGDGLCPTTSTTTTTTTTTTATTATTTSSATYATKTTTINTTTRTTMAQIADCAYALSTCTAACEVGASRTITVTREPSSVQAKQCPSKTDLPDCLPGDGLCPTTFTTTTTTTTTTATTATTTSTATSATKTTTTLSTTVTSTTKATPATTTHTNEPVVDGNGAGAGATSANQVSTAEAANDGPRSKEDDTFVLIGIIVAAVFGVCLLVVAVLVCRKQQGSPRAIDQNSQQHVRATSNPTYTVSDPSDACSQANEVVFDFTIQALEQEDGPIGSDANLDVKPSDNDCSRASQDNEPAMLVSNKGEEDEFGGFEGIQLNEFGFEDEEVC